MRRFYWLFSFSLIGLCPSALTAQVDSLRTIQLQDLVITASRMKEDITKSPVSIEKISQSTIQQSPAPSFFDEIEHTRGVPLLIIQTTAQDDGFRWDTHD